MVFFCRFWLCPSIYILKINEIIAVATGTPFQRQERKSLETKQTQVKPNANRGWPMKPVNHIRPQLIRLCPNSSWTPTSQNADGAPPYWGFQRYVCLHIAGDLAAPQPTMPHVTYFHLTQSLTPRWTRAITIIGWLQLPPCLSTIWNNLPI